ncbi:MAG: phosphate acyltransferase PlsX [Thermodesulfovibrionales bacterium]|nr:phosphate acyltransferase PlsX [Thermodesulfovibrionales bacterium]
MRVALDAMGGDNAPAVNIEGAAEAVNEWPDIEVVLVGDGELLQKELSVRKYPKSKITVLHASESITMDEQLSQALRRKKDSSIRRAFELVKAAEADAVVSAGHSGITMALALLLIGTAKGVERPAIAALIPSLKKEFVLLDVGANVDCTPQNLLQFALMADAYCRLILDRPKPKIALLSIGEEPTKGNELTKEAFRLLKAADINFFGNMEGRDIFKGDADVVVCDGFIGNVVLKSSEGLAEATIKMLRKEITSLTTGRIGYFFIKSALKNFKKKTDYAEYGGAPLLGINGTCIICHGRSTTKAIKNAVRMAADFSSKRVYEAISEEIGQAQPREKTVVAG